MSQSTSTWVTPSVRPKPSANESTPGSEVRLAATVVIGVGNPLKADDGIGPRVVERLVPSPRVLVINAETVPENYLDRVERAKPERVIIVDACDFGGRPGEFRLFPYDEFLRLPWRAFSTHTLPLSLFAQLAHELTHARIELLGIQPEEVLLREELSPALARAESLIVSFLRDLVLAPAATDPERSPPA